MSVFINKTSKNAPLISEDVLQDLQSRSLIIFDFDGTLADTLPTIVSTAKIALADCGHTDYREADLKKLVGPPFPYAFQSVFGLTYNQAVEVTKRYRELYVHTGRWPLFSGIYELIEDLHKVGKKVAVASSKNEPVLEIGLKDTKLIDVLDAYVGRQDEAETSKVDAVAQVMKNLRYEPQQSVMIGDRCFDMEAAFPNQIPSVGVLYGHTTEQQELVDANAIAVVDTVDDLRNVLLNV